jgi:hypothetical protein
MNPFLACGWLAGLVEAGIRKPTVQDIDTIPQDIFSFKGFFPESVSESACRCHYGESGKLNRDLCCRGQILSGTFLVRPLIP